MYVVTRHYSYSCVTRVSKLNSRILGFFGDSVSTAEATSNDTAE
jgi:hypothetical protein